MFLVWLEVRLRQRRIVHKWTCGVRRATAHVQRQPLNVHVALYCSRADRDYNTRVTVPLVIVPSLESWPRRGSKKQYLASPESRAAPVAERSRAEPEGRRHRPAPLPCAHPHVEKQVVVLLPPWVRGAAAPEVA